MSTKKDFKNKVTNFILLGSVFFKGKVGLLEGQSKKGGSFRFSWSNDGIIFKPDREVVYFSNGLTNHKADQCSNFRFANIGKSVFATYIRTLKSKKYRIIAELKNIHEWQVVSETLVQEDLESLLVSNVKNTKERILYEGGSFVKCFTSKDWENWNDNGSLLFTTRFDHFDRDTLKLIGSFVSDKGTLVFYESIVSEKEVYRPCIGMVIFDKTDPRKIVWRSSDPIWISDVSFAKENECKTLGMVVMNENMYFYFSIGNTIITISLAESDLSLHIPKASHKALIKHKKNPIIAPHPHNRWENEAIFNPAAIQDDEGHTHLIYRAIGSDGVSRLGYGYSRDGVNFNGRMSVPLFAMGNPRENKKLKFYDPSMYPSGGSWGGCEDPRAVRINGRVYVTFNAFDGWDFMRIGVISMDEKLFFKNNWEWSKPLFISPKNEINKNWVLFPEKINGKFAILHRIWPKVGVEYVDSFEKLADGTQKVEKHWHAGGYYSSMPKKWVPVYQGTPGFKWVDPDHMADGVWNLDENKSWDTWIRSAGPPPIKTADGWLVLYHAMDEKEKHAGYKLGALLLDLKDPEKVIARSKTPIISPDEWYESDWKPRIVYACGSAIKNEDLYIYYGGGDKYVCVATISLKKLLNDLRRDKVVLHKKDHKLKNK